MIQIVDGRAIARKIIEDLERKPRPTKELAVFLVGDDPSSVSFIKKKEKAARALGILFRLYRHRETEPTMKIIEALAALARADQVGGIVLQLPLPDKYPRNRFLEIIPPQKDVDNLTGRSAVLAPVALTAEAVLRETKTDIRDLTVAVVGRGFLVGAPIIHWIKPRCRRLMILSRASGLKGIATADLVISGVGKARLIQPDQLKNGARVIDFGYDLDASGNLSGDLDARQANQLAWYTPTPGGTGPILVAKLFENFYQLNE